jgi:hypothetical protein
MESMDVDQSGKETMNGFAPAPRMEADCK